MREILTGVGVGLLCVASLLAVVAVGACWTALTVKEKRDEEQDRLN